MPHLSYQHPVERVLQYALWNGSNWDVRTADGDVRSDLATGIAVDGLQRPHITYLGSGESNLRYTQWDGTSWHAMGDGLDRTGRGGRHQSLCL